MKKLFKRYKKAIATILLLIILGALVYWAYLSYQNRDFGKETGNKSATVDQVNNDKDKSSTKQPETATGDTNTVDTTKNTADIPVSKETTIYIDRLNQEGSDVVYASTITNPGTNGTCSAVFTKTDSRPVTQVNNTNTGNCGPFTVPRAEFDTPGVWLLTLRYYTDSSQAVATKTIEINR